MFQGGSGSLDHVFASASMLPEVTGHTIWDINATESFAYEYDAADEGLFAPDPYRANDHNPTLIGVDTKTGTPRGGQGPPLIQAVGSRRPRHPCSGWRGRRTVGA